VARVLLAPFAEALSRKTRVIDTAGRFIRRIRMGPRDVGRTEAGDLSSDCRAGGSGFGLAFPPVGAPLGIAVAIFLGGLDFFDIPLSTRGLPLRNKLSVIWRNKALALDSAPQLI